MCQPVPANDVRPGSRSRGSVRVAFFVAQPGTWDGATFSFDHLNLIDFFSFVGTRQDVAEVALCLPIRTGASRGAVWAPPNHHVRVVRLPFWNDEVDLIRRLPVLLPRILGGASPAIRTANVAGATLPGLTGALFLTLARIYGTPTFALVRGFPRRTIAGARAPTLSTRLMLAAMRALEIYGAFLVRTGTQCVPMAPGLAKQLHLQKRVPIVSPILDPLFRLDARPQPRPTRRRRLLYVGRLSGEKNLRSLIRALKLIESDPSWTLTIAGFGTLRDELEQMVQGLGLRSRITFAGRVEHDESLRTLYLNHDIFVLPSFTEGAPRALAEAMGMGLCPIASAVGGIPEMLEDGRCGYLVPDPHPEGIAAALKAALDAGEDLERRADAAWEKSRSFTFPAAAGELTRILEGLVNANMRERT